MYIESEFMRLDVGTKGFITAITDKTHSKTIPVDLKVKFFSQVEKFSKKN